MNLSQNYDALSLEELDNAATAFRVQTLRLGGFLAERCGGMEEAQRAVRLALDMPLSVLLREAAAAERVIETGETPSVAQVAAIVARMVATVDAIGAAQSRKQAGASLQ